MKSSHVLIVSAGLIATTLSFTYWSRVKEQIWSRVAKEQNNKSRVVKEQNNNEKIIPLKKSKMIEGFPHYVVRQLGFEDPVKVPFLCLLLQQYLKKSEGYDERMYEYIFNGNIDNVDHLYTKLEHEFERCILSYFSFYWDEVATVVNKAINPESSSTTTKLREIALTATREERFKRLSKELKMTRIFSTLIEEMKALHGQEMIPVNRSPVLLLMGGGMGAGKSTIRDAILKEAFWLQVATNHVIVEADAFKHADEVYKTLNTADRPFDYMEQLKISESVHENSTRAAESLLVTALNEGRDVIMDGTMSWEPFVRQTIAMARNVHRCRYRIGRGYHTNDDGTADEKYWEEITDEQGETSTGKTSTRQPYRIELVGAVCDSYIAIVRAIRRVVVTGRAVRVSAQLKSHQNFARAFPDYCELVDNARLYFTNAIDHPPKLIGWKDGGEDLLVHPQHFKCMERIANLNVEANCIYNLYKESNIIMEPGSIWQEMILAPSRIEDQKELKEAIEKSENHECLLSEE
ncbi:calmodulin calcium-dependent NAD kinase [Vigna angularis]|nr:calmodulin calcium-dependent NAD kinase [Vigna angularis]XP_052731045.1 calmodulin calcium-dependent NAD kinase [Vigna angularis]XP_052731046.1 calmodulin calcium-dependent NAD kinase [Vigna angularis]